MAALEQQPEILHFLSDCGAKISRDTDVRGKVLHDSQGRPIGNVHDFVISSDGTKIVYLEVSTHGFFGAGKKHFLIPVDDVRLHHDHKLYVKVEGGSSEEEPWNCPDLGSSLTSSVAAFSE